MQAHELSGVRAKLKRADIHLDDLNDAINVFLSEDNYRFTGEENMEGQYGHRRVFLEIDTFPPDEIWGPIIGDAVHNMRSALDHLAWEIALPELRVGNPIGIEFPISYDDPAESAEARPLFTRKLERLRPEFHAVIEAAQPYKTRDLHHPLWLLQRLWTVDKHRTLHIAHYMFSVGADDPANPLGYSAWRNHPIDRTEHRTQITYSRGTSNDTLEEQVDANNALTRDVALGKPDDPPSDAPWTRDYPFAGLPLRPALRRIRAFVEAEVVAPIERLL